MAGDGGVGDKFGSSVSISGDLAVVGAEYDDDRGLESGSVYVFRYDGTSWREEHKLTPRAGANDYHFGSAVALDGTRLVVGADHGVDMTDTSRETFYRGIGQVYVYDLDAQGLWTRDMFETLFPEPSPGWLISTMQVQELKTFAQLSGIEGMSNMAGGISGAGAQAPSVRYQLTRAYRDSRDSTHTFAVVIDSENIELASLVLAAHGYSSMKDGKPVPLADDKKPLQDQILSSGAKLFEHPDHLGIYMVQDSLAFISILVDETGVMGLSCEYMKCFDDLNALVKRTDFQRLDVFARFDHRKQSKGE